jgi:hypothetical protein
MSLLAVDDEEKALVVHARDVAGMQPAIGVDDLRGLLRPLPVAGHHLRTLHAQLADRVGPGDDVAFLVLEHDVGGGIGTPMAPLYSARSSGFMQQAGEVSVRP